MGSSALVWLNGDLMRETEALVPATGHGQLLGRGLFETLGVRDGQPFALTRHLERLRAAAARLRLEMPADEVWRGGIGRLMENSPASRACGRLRLTLTAGPHAGRGLEPGGEQQLIQLTPWQPAETPATLITVPWRRNEFSPLSGLKATAWTENVIALAWVRERDGTEACFLNTSGDICEGAASNLFLVKDRTVITPSPGSGCLPGITRALIIELCEQLEIACQERAVTPAMATAADAAFLTSSLRGVQPVTTWDNRTLPADDPISALLSAALKRLQQELPDP